MGRVNNMTNPNSVIEGPSLLLPIQIGSGKVRIKVQANYMKKDDNGNWTWAPCPTYIIFEHILPIADQIANISVSITELPMEVKNV